ncbi:hypothetical protein AVEN_145042-1 [Araneus ventricosus]|uniref:Uncharacterized protein n=1 Tax=Araneus ventricosus TaxID=182803 RepID=A0A4Y2MFL2_ARAVE|nr:hypothetical protein AVEN_59848-1 [Araneus ventricosus]GBN25423.1 hypothetical protein AVEN_145042-1 [Araneus ventricosus]
MTETPKGAGPLDSCLLDNPTLEHMKIPTETTIRSKAIYFPRLKNRPERIVLRQPRECTQRNEKRREGQACGHPFFFNIVSVILLLLTLKQRLLENVRVAVYLELLS